ncbi:PIN domain-containing protein [Lysobacter enzymogenes]|uniref:PIN domain-containing protein n=1 Tax=Lysobacter enzymogenes TaxID=69 RepID=UPI00099DA90C|nr:PIN domain-containing protein [Lysobacter enzymogenes]UZW62836.1 PIN domain-containing protein [Lysobacter enzymogenes]
MGSMTIKRRYAPDTNFFLQFKPAEELPWGDLTDERVDAVELIVLLEVARELDGHKSSPSARRSKRARKILALLDPLLDSPDPDLELVIREKGPRVSYRWAPIPPANRDRPANLDMAKADNRIVEEALACSTHFYGGELALVTRDSGVRVFARAVGLKCHRLPDAWGLAPESDESEKEIKALRERIRVLESFQPQISVDLSDNGQPISQVVQATVTLYPSLSESFLDRVVQAVADAHPEQKARVFMGTVVTEPEEASRYNLLRKDWLLSVRQHIAARPIAWNETHEPYKINLSLKNLGTASADRLVVDVFAHGVVRLVDPDTYEEEQEDPEDDFPQRPQLLSGLAAFPIMPVPRLGLGAAEFKLPRLPGPPGRHFEWCWDEPEHSSSRLEGECAEFRHDIGHEDIALLLRAAPEAENSSTGRLEVRYSATNLPQSQTKIWRVEFTVLPGDSEAMACQLLKRELGVEL